MLLESDSKDLTEEEHEFLPMISKTVYVPPLNFAMVTPGVYRSGYPGKKNYPFLRRLKIKTLICLDPEPYRNLEFLNDEGIKFFQYKISGNKEPHSLISQETLAEAVSKLLDERYHPVLLHCNKGKHRVGCAVGCLRRIQNFSTAYIFSEYQRFAGSKIRVLDQQYIEIFDISLIKYDQEHKPKWLFS